MIPIPSTTEHSKSQTRTRQKTNTYCTKKKHNNNQKGRNQTTTRCGMDNEKNNQGTNIIAKNGTNKEKDEVELKIEKKTTTTTTTTKKKKKIVDKTNYWIDHDKFFCYRGGVLIPEEVQIHNRPRYPFCYMDEYRPIIHVIIDINCHVFEKRSTFAQRDLLQTVDMSKATYLEKIEDYTFAHCPNLTKVLFCNDDQTPHESSSATLSSSSSSSTSSSSSIKEIGVGAFSFCTSISSIILPDSLRIIHDDAFQFCTSLRHITIPKYVTKIGRRAFKSCFEISTIEFEINNDNDINNNNDNNNHMDNHTSSSSSASSYMTEICDETFFNCCNLTSITIPYTIEKIGTDAFHGCMGLTNVTFGTGTTSVSSTAATATTATAMDRTRIVESKLQKIGKRSFACCTQLSDMEFLSTTNSLRIIGYAAFEGCASVASIRLPNHLKVLGQYAFYNCTLLESVTVPLSTVVSLNVIRPGIFQKCPKLITMTVDRQQMSAVSSSSSTSLSLSLSSTSSEPLFSSTIIGNDTITVAQLLQFACDVSRGGYRFFQRYRYHVDGNTSNDNNMNDNKNNNDDDDDNNDDDTTTATTMTTIHSRQPQQQPQQEQQQEQQQQYRRYPVGLWSLIFYRIYNDMKLTRVIDIPTKTTIQTGTVNRNRSKAKHKQQQQQQSLTKHENQRRRASIIYYMFIHGTVLDMIISQ